MIVNVFTFVNKLFTIILNIYSKFKGKLKMSNVTFIKNAEHVELQQIGRNKGDLKIIVNDQEARLNRRHPIAVSASLTDPQIAAQALQRGHFVFENGTDHKGNDVQVLREYRDSSYNGFMQSDEFLERFGGDDSLLSRGLSTFDIAEYGLGGKFNLSTGFTWSAFQRNLKTQVNVVRQICDNGMVARSRMFEREVPVINLYDHHLDIAARQLIDISRRELTRRIEIMGREHSTNKEVRLVYNHIEKRYKQNRNDPRLSTLMEVIEEYSEISQFYTKNAIDNGIVKSLAAPISRYDLWNIVTEMNSHTEELIESTGDALNKIATGLIFPKNVGTAITENKSKSTFGSPEQAFFGA